MSEEDLVSVGIVNGSVARWPMLSYRHCSCFILAYLQKPWAAEEFQKHLNTEDGMKEIMGKSEYAYASVRGPSWLVFVPTDDRKGATSCL